MAAADATKTACCVLDCAVETAVGATFARALYGAAKHTRQLPTIANVLGFGKTLGTGEDGAVRAPMAEEADDKRTELRFVFQVHAAAVNLFSAPMEARLRALLGDADAATLAYALRRERNRISDPTQPLARAEVRQLVGHLQRNGADLVLHEDRVPGGNLDVHAMHVYVVADDDATGADRYGFVRGVMPPAPSRDVAERMEALLDAPIESLQVAVDVQVRLSMPALVHLTQHLVDHTKSVMEQRVLGPLTARVRLLCGTHQAMVDEEAALKTKVRAAQARLEALRGEAAKAADELLLKEAAAAEACARHVLATERLSTAERDVRDADKRLRAAQRRAEGRNAEAARLDAEADAHAARLAALRAKIADRARRVDEALVDAGAYKLELQLARRFRDGIRAECSSSRQRRRSVAFV